MSDTELKREYVEMLEKENAELHEQVKELCKGIDIVNNVGVGFRRENLQLKEQVKELCKGIDTVNNVGVGFRRENAALKEQNETLKSGVDNAIEIISKERCMNARLLAMLKELETDKNGVCPKCRNYCLTGHNANCSLGNLLAEIRKDGSNG